MLITEPAELEPVKLVKPVKYWIQTAEGALPQELIDSMRMVSWTDVMLLDGFWFNSRTILENLDWCNFLHLVDHFWFPHGCCTSRLHLRAAHRRYTSCLQLMLGENLGSVLWLGLANFITVSSTAKNLTVPCWVI